jgi:hypothetical protein
MTQERVQEDRRRHARFRLGLPVKMHLDGDATPMTVELIDIGEQGVRFRLPGDSMQLDQRAAFGFVIPGQHVYVAHGRVVRVDDGGEFVLSLDQANHAFRNFLGSLAL